MDEFNDQESQSNLPLTPFSARIESLFEVALVGTGGYLAVPLLFAWLGIGNQLVLGDARYLVAMLVTEATVTLLLLAGLLRLKGERLAALGWTALRLPREAWIGVLYLPVLFASTYAISLAFRAWIPDYVTQENPLLALVKTPTDLLLLIFSSIYVGGIKEELQRAFILSRFEKNLGGPLAGLVIWSTVFGLGHSVQGVDSAVAAAVLGLLFGILYLWRRHLGGPVASHALYDILTLLVYWFFLAEYV